MYLEVRGAWGDVGIDEDDFLFECFTGEFALGALSAGGLFITALKS